MKRQTFEVKASVEDVQATKFESTPLIITVDSVNITGSKSSDAERVTGVVTGYFDGFENMHEVAKFYGTEQKIVEALNEQLKTKAYPQFYVPLKTQLEGPDKAVDKIAKGLLKNAATFGITLTEGQARERAKIALGL